MVKSLTGMFSHEFNHLAQKQLATKLGAAITDPVMEKEVGQKALLREVSQKKEAKKEEVLAEANAAKESAAAKDYTAAASNANEATYKAGLKGYMDLRSIMTREATLMAARAKFTPLVVCPAGSCTTDEPLLGLRKCTKGSALLDLACPAMSRKQIAQNMASFKCINCNVGGTCGITKGRCSNGEFGWSCGGCMHSLKGAVTCTECPQYTMPPADLQVEYTSEVKEGGVVTESDKRLNMFARPKLSSQCKKSCGECATNFEDSVTGGKLESCVNVKRYNQHIKDAQPVGQQLEHVAVLRANLKNNTKVYAINKNATSFPGLANPPNAKSQVFSVRCCLGAGSNSTCTSRTKARKCYPKALTFDEAEAVCKADGRRLCTFGESSLCHGTGCMYDEHYSWISGAPTRLEVTMAAPIITDVNVSAGVVEPTQFFDEPSKDDDQCKLVSEPIDAARKATKLREARTTGIDVPGEEVNGAMSRACEWFKDKPYIAAPAMDCTCAMLEKRACEAREDGGYEFTECAVPEKMTPVLCPPTAARSTGSAFDVCTECNKKGVCQLATRMDGCGPVGCSGCKWIKKSATSPDESTCENCPTLVSTDASTKYGASSLLNKDGRPFSSAMPCKKDCQECYMPANEIYKNIDDCDAGTYTQEARCVNVWRYNHNNPGRSMDTKITADNQECALQIPGSTHIYGRRRRAHGQACKTPAPTPAPTAAPTEAPTAAPTVRPKLIGGLAGRHCGYDGAYFYPIREPVECLFRCQKSDPAVRRFFLYDGKACYCCKSSWTGSWWKSNPLHMGYEVDGRRL